jgi:hypothetical protein
MVVESSLEEFGMQFAGLTPSYYIGKKSGLARADLDRFNPAQDVAGAAGHLFLEVIPHLFN